MSELKEGSIYVDHDQAYLYMGILSYKKTNKHVSGSTFIKIGSVSNVLSKEWLMRYCKDAVSNKQSGLIQTEKGRKRLQKELVGVSLSANDIHKLCGLGSFVRV